MLHALGAYMDILVSLTKNMSNLAGTIIISGPDSSISCTP